MEFAISDPVPPDPATDSALSRGLAAATYQCGKPVSPREVGRALWEHLQALDTRLPDLDQDGCGEVVGGVIRVRFVRDANDTLFACEVIHRNAAVWWEAGIARIASQACCAFWRVLQGEA